ncbi:MAG: hypothetical protein KF729_30925 [Sandaracinaceae bacterium]|nr:hypothetical protein [Sandaracinaceae bacterium]
MAAGLCGGCAHARRVETRRGTVYLRCVAPGLPKYPLLPVLSCASHAPRALA